MNSVYRVQVAGRVLSLTEHAVARYRERVRDSMTEQQAADELVRVLPYATLVYERPSWLVGELGADAYVMLTDDIVFPLVKRSLVSCMTPYSAGETVQEARRVRKRKAKRQRRREKRSNEKQSVRREQRHRRRERLARVADEEAA